MTARMKAAWYQRLDICWGWGWDEKVLLKFYAEYYSTERGKKNGGTPVNLRDFVRVLILAGIEKPLSHWNNVRRREEAFIECMAM